MFIDTAKVFIKAGTGGNGAISFRREIYVPKGGPDGGTGGKGGDVVFEASKDENTLLSFRYNPELTAPDGKNGSKRQAAGRSGEDLVVKVPVGTVLKKSTGEIVADLAEDGERAIVARGGDGGFGNSHFKSSTRQTPKFAELGIPGEEYEGIIELKLLADVGLVGFPNAGKSSFLASVSNATPEVADYPFTTITPNLGIATIDDYDILIADIPGLIEGASEGKGLGHAFLRHTERTKVLLHMVDVYSDDAGAAYQTIRQELAHYSEDLAKTPEIVALTKVEGLDDEIVELQKQSILAINPSAQIFAISSLAHLGVKDLLRALRKIIEETKKLEDDIPPEDQALIQESLAKPADSIPVISLPQSDTKDDWSVARNEDGSFTVTGAKIERFAIKTDVYNYESANRLRDIMKKLGIRSELTRLGAEPDSIIHIAGRSLTLVEL